MSVYALFAAGSLAGIFILVFRYFFANNHHCISTTSLYGKTAIVTGCDIGIGGEIASELAHRGARVVITAKTLGAAEECAAEILAKAPQSWQSHVGEKGYPVSTNLELAPRQLDLSSFASVRSFANSFKASEIRLDILVNNSSVFWLPYSKTEDGFETVFQENYLGHFLLTHLLLDLLKEADAECGQARVVQVSSGAYRWVTTPEWSNISDGTHYSRRCAYGISRLAQILFARQLSKKLQDAGIEGMRVNAADAGPVWVNHGVGPAWMQPLFSLSHASLRPRCSRTTLCLILHKEFSKLCGQYFSNCQRTKLRLHARDDRSAKQLWALSKKWTGLVVDRQARAPATPAPDKGRPLAGSVTPELAAPRAVFLDMSSATAGELTTEDEDEHYEDMVDEVFLDGGGGRVAARGLTAWPDDHAAYLVHHAVAR